MSSLETVASMKAEYEAKVAAFDSLSQEISTDMKSAEDKGFDAGLAQAGVPATDKIYTEADLQNEKKLAVDSALAQAQLDADAKLQESLKSLKLDIAQKIEDTQVDNMALVSELKA
jgi:hypothetical protein